VFVFLYHFILDIGATFLSLVYLLLCYTVYVSVIFFQNIVTNIIIIIINLNGTV